jgi:hypothetical protein
MEIHEGLVGKKSFSHQDVVVGIFDLECELCCFSKVSKEEKE